MPVRRRSSYDEYLKLLESDLAQSLVGHQAGEEVAAGPDLQWPQYVSQNITKALLKAPDTASIDVELLHIGRAALEAFLQATVTGPPLWWDSVDLLLSKVAFDGFNNSVHLIRQQLKASLTVDGEAVYHLLPHAELFAFAKIILTHADLEETNDLLQWRLRVNMWHQRLLSDLAPALQDSIYRDLQLLDFNKSAEFLVERASVHLLHGLDARARADLKDAASRRHFEYVLTGRLGKRTKFQDRDISQLVVLAKSSDNFVDTKNANGAAPEAVRLDDDTLLESMTFSKAGELVTDLTSDNNIPESLSKLNPADQPLLLPLDSIILLLTASSVTNTSPQDGLTREETIPYAERVLSGGSSNWQVYTQALLLRSRIESYKSRTAERGVLQLQSLVDQVIVDISNLSDIDRHKRVNPSTAGASTFLPRPKTSESAPVSDRLQFIHQLGSPPSWKLEAELADRWVSLGALRTALEIYERLELWAEVALCWAASDREDKARKIVRQQLYNQGVSADQVGKEDGLAAEECLVEKDPLPNDAPRLFCILGDLDKFAAPYERAWQISNGRYARAQRSLGRLYLTNGDVKEAEEAYAKSLTVRPQNHATWFALGCVRLQLQAWKPAITAFSRAVQIDDADSESWSNLAIALLKASASNDSSSAAYERSERVKESFVAVKRAAALKRDSFHIWQNLLSVAIKIEPPPYADIIIAQTRLIELLGATEGERCIDIPIMEALLADTIRMSQDKPTLYGEANGVVQHNGLEKMVADLIQKKIAPLVTTSRRLWLLTAKLAIFLQRPHAALTAYEKAWRSQVNQPGWDLGLSSQSKTLWKEVAESTVDLIDAYESLGEKTREAGMGEGELVAKEWKFKARSAARSVLSRAKDVWEYDEAYVELQDRLHGLKSG